MVFQFNTELDSQSEVHMIWSFWSVGFVGFMGGFVAASLFSLNRNIELRRACYELSLLDISTPAKRPSESDAEHSFRMYCKIERLKKAVGRLVAA
jgi:hypothetical protein